MLYLAFRQMLSRKKQTLLIFLGVSFGTMIYIVIAGLQFGFRSYLYEQLLNNTSHVLITGKEGDIVEKEITPRFFGEDEFVRWLIPPQGKRSESKLENPQSWFDRLSADPDVVAFAPRLSISGMASKSRHRTNVNITGIIPSRQVKITSLEDYMKVGSILDLSGGGNKLIVGSGVLKELGAKVGESINLSTGLGESRPFKIIGLIEMGNEQIDKVMVLGNIRDIQTLNKTPGRIGEITVALVDIKLSKEKADKWSLYSNDNVESWDEANAQFMQMISIQDIMRLVITGAILLVAGFGIYNILTIMISQKQKEIAILRSIGYGPDKILELFLFQGLMLGFGGGLLGIGLGFVINLFMESIELSMRIGKSNHLPVSYDLSIYITAFAAAQIAAAIASYLPARAASKLTPLEIIRSEMG